VARVGLWLSECEGDLPPICMRCGADGHNRVNREFPVVAAWMELSPLAELIARTFARRVRLVAPLCDRHRLHWASRTWVVYGASFVALLLLAGFAWAALDPATPPPLFASGVLLVAASQGLSWHVQKGAIRPYRFMREAVWWVNVADRFVDHVGYRRAETGRPTPADPVASSLPLPPPPLTR
jgi:hypothetical protein